MLQRDKIIRQIINTIFLIFTCSALNAQVRFYAQVSDGPLLPYHSFQIQYVAEGASGMEDFVIKEMKGLLLLDSFTNYNKSAIRYGESAKSTFTKVLVVMASKDGIYNVPVATARFNGKKKEASTFSISIGSGNESNISKEEIQVPVHDYSVLYSNEDLDRKIRSNVFIKVELGKSGCFVGEGITVTYKLYSRMDARSIVLKRPAFKNCSVLEMVDQYDSSAVVELYNGSPYYTNLIRKVHLFPLQAGAIPLDFAEVLTTVNFVRSNLPSIDSKNASAIQNKNYGKSSSQRTVSIRSEPRVLNVKQLPVETVPASFKGAVGEFNLTLSADQLSVLPRSLVKLQLRVLGKGNFPLLLPPQLQWPMGVDSTDYQSKEVYDPYRYPLSGYKEFEFRFTAPDTGSYFFPPVSFSYYNPEKSSYQTLRSNGLRVEVHTGSTNEKIVLHKPAPEQLPKQYYWFIGVVLIVIGVIFSQVVAIRKEHQLEPITEFLVPIPELPKDYFLEARIAYFSEEKELFVDSLLKAIWNFFEQEWKLNPANHTKADLEKMMNQRQVDDSLKIELMHLLSQCEWMRYATAEADIDKCKELLFEAERLTELLKP